MNWRGSAADQRLEHVYLVIWADRIGQPLAVAQCRAIDIDRDMLAQRTLIVEHIAAQGRPLGEHRGERLGDRAALDLRRRRIQKAPQRRGERHGRHVAAQGSTYTIHETPNLSASMPKAGEKKVLPS